MIYKLLVLIHVLTAIVGIGHTFLLPYAIYFPKTGQEIRSVYSYINRIDFLAKYSDWILLVTGLGMVYLGKMGLSVGWINLSLILFLVLRISVTLEWSGRGSDLWPIALAIEGDVVPKEYYLARSAFLPKLYFVQFIVFLIIVVMIIKPNIPLLALTSMP